MNQPMLVQVERLPGWRSAREKFDELDPSWAFRGQADSSWTLQSSLERIVPHGDERVVREYVVAREFMRRARLYQNDISIETTALDWLVLMQHYGAPTRLVDFTRSPYVALFFALESTATDAAVWAVDLLWCREESLNLISKSDHFHTNRDFNILHHIHQEFTRLFLSNVIDYVFLVESMRVTQRPAMQRGIFLCPGNISIPFMRNFYPFSYVGMTSLLKKFVIPVAARPAILRELDRMGISRESLFPGLDGLGQAMRHRAELLTAHDINTDFREVNSPNAMEQLFLAY